MVEIFKKLLSGNGETKGSYSESSPDGSAFGITDIGLVRDINQDAFGIIPEIGLFVVADGMGGHKAGEVASKLAVGVIKEHFTEERVESMKNNPVFIEQELSSGIMRSHDKILEMSASNKELAGMGTTLILAFVHEGHVHTCHVGDSRAYIISPEGIFQITYDHSMVGELVRYGMMSTEEARHSPNRSQISQAAGAPFKIEPEYMKHPVEPGDFVLLCSDGLWEMLTDEEIRETVLSDCPIAEVGNELVRKSNELGGRDNIAVVLCEL